MTKVLLFGSGGFIGRNVGEALREAGHEVVDTYRQAGEREGYSVDLLDQEAVGEVLERVQPEIVINCAGIVKNNEEAEANPKHTENILSQVVARHIPIRRVVVLGSAAEYGVVDEPGQPVGEETPLRASNDYGTSKVRETEVALKYRQEEGLSVVVARVFNPVGPGMPPQQLTPRLIGQIDELKRGEREALEVNRLDAPRDYVDVRDLAGAIALLATGAEPKHAVYNIGSGRATTNGELVDLIISQSQLDTTPPIVEASDTPEPNFAAQADISRLQAEYGWKSATPLEQTVKEVVEDVRRQQG